MLVPTIDPYLSNEDNIFKPMPSINFKIYNDTTKGKIDELEAVKQAVFLILSTERSMFPIYPAEYGITTIDLIGKDYGWVASELQRRIKEALLYDERVKDVVDFDFTRDEDSIDVGFVVESVFGRFDMDFKTGM